MTKKEFIKRMNSSIQFVQSKTLHPFSCFAINKNFNGCSIGIAKYVKIKNYYLKSIEQLLINDNNLSCFIDWKKLNIKSFEKNKIKEYRVKLLTNFMNKCLDNEFYLTI